MHEENELDNILPTANEILGVPEENLETWMREQLGNISAFIYENADDLKKGKAIYWEPYYTPMWKQYHQMIAIALENAGYFVARELSISYAAGHIHHTEAEAALPDAPRKISISIPYATDEGLSH